VQNVISLPAWNNDAAAGAIAEGISTGLFQDNRFKSEPEDQANICRTLIYWDQESGARNRLQATKSSGVRF